MMRWFIPLAALLILVGVHASAQDSLPDVSGQWVGVIEWDSVVDESWIAPNVRIYRLNILQDGSDLRATHIVQGDEAGNDLIVTRPVERFDEPRDYGFGGTFDGTTLHFEEVPVYMGHCGVNITLEYLTVGDEAVLVGNMIRPILVLPTLEHTLTPTESWLAVDVPIGCSPPTGALVLRRFAPLSNEE
jgi:hypothetical protein